MSESLLDRDRRIRRAKLTMGQTFYLVTMSLYVGYNPSAWPSQTAIAAAMNATTRAVRKWQTELEQLGIIQVDVGRGRSTTNRYRLNLDRLIPKEESRSSLNEEPRSGITADDAPNEEPRSALMRNHVPVNEEPRSYGKNKKVHKKEQEGKSPISLASSEGRSHGKSDSKLTAFCLEWNLWHSAGIVRRKIRDTDSPGKTIVDAWKRSQRDREQRERLQDVARLRAEIEASQILLKPAGWFDAAGLIGGKNSNRRWYAEQLLEKTYRDKSGGGTPAAPEAEQAWQSLLDSTQRHSSYSPDKIQAEVTDRAWRAVRAVGGVKEIDAVSNDFDGRELKKRFYQAWHQQGETA